MKPLTNDQLMDIAAGRRSWRMRLTLRVMRWLGAYQCRECGFFYRENAPPDVQEGQHALLCPTRAVRRES